MVGSGERFNTAVTVTCTVGLVIVLQRMRALQRQVDTLAELARGHETSLQWLTQRMETPVIRASGDPAASKGLSLPPPVSRGISRQDSWQSSLEGGGYETATEELFEEPLSAATTPKKPADPRLAAAEPLASRSTPSSMAGGGVSGGGVSDPDAANKWSCVTMQHGGPPSCGPSGSATSDTLRSTPSAEHLSIASVPPSPAAPRPANDPESAGAVLDALKQAQPAATRRNPPPPPARPRPSPASRALPCGLRSDPPPSALRPPPSALRPMALTPTPHDQRPTTPSPPPSPPPPSRRCTRQTRGTRSSASRRRTPCCSRSSAWVAPRSSGASRVSARSSRRWRGALTLTLPLT